ncbi:MAG: hypothetical protein Fur009_3860 [Candidatus Microgenomates bacterium]
MKKLILKILITGFIVLFFTAKNVYSEYVASGSSAQLVKLSDEYYTNNLNYKIKEIAIRNILERYHSPLLGEEKNFIDSCRRYELDCFLLPSIAGLESTFGRFIWPNSYNPFGWGGGYIMFDSWKQSIDIVAKGLRENYLNKGAKTIEQIGPIYSESPTWATRVNWFKRQFEKEQEKINLLFTDFPVKL